MTTFPKTLFVVIVAALLIACPGNKQSRHDSRPASQAGLIYTVKKVIDGDSLIATRAREDLEIRLFGIDAPEYGQPFSREAKSAASTLLNKQTIRVVIEDTDRYQRAVAWVYVDTDEISVNVQLVEQGAAWVYRRYTTDKELIKKENLSKSKNLGLWALPPHERIPPWEWRKTHAN